MQKFVIVGGAVMPMEGRVVVAMKFFFKADWCQLHQILMSLIIGYKQPVTIRQEKKKGEEEKERKRFVITIKFFFVIPSHQ